MKQNDKRTRTCFLEKYGDLSLQDIFFEKIYYIDYEDIHFVKHGRYSLISNPDNSDGT